MSGAGREKRARSQELRGRHSLQNEVASRMQGDEESKGALKLIPGLGVVGLSGRGGPVS